MAWSKTVVTSLLMPRSSMAWCKTAVTPLLAQWSYHSLALRHRYHGCYHVCTCVWVGIYWVRHILALLLCDAGWVNSSPPSAAYMRQWTGSALVRVIACRLFGAKPLPEPMLTYCQLDPWEQTSVNRLAIFRHTSSWLLQCQWSNRNQYRYIRYITE